MHSWKEDCKAFRVLLYVYTYHIYIVKTSVFLSCDRKYYLLVSMLKRPRDS